MTTLSIQPPFPLITDIDGQPLEDGYIWIGTANLPPIGNPIAVYWDAALTQTAALPIRTQGGYPVNAGTPARLYVGSDYSILVQNKNGSTLYSAPDGASDRFSAAQISFLQAGAGAVVRTVQSKLRDVVSVRDFGAVGDGVTDDTAAIQAALDASISVVVPKGIYVVTSTLNIPAYNTLVFDGGATINYTSAVSPVIRVRRGCKIYGNGVQINTTTNPYNGSVIYLSGTDNFGGANETAIVDNIKIAGQSISGGIGLHLEAKNAGEYISFVLFSRISVYLLNQAVLLDCGTSGSAGTPASWHWINGNTFREFTLIHNRNNVTGVGLNAVPAEVAGNFFSDISIQMNLSEAPAVLFDGASKNYFDGHVWDWDYTVSPAISAIRFANSAQNNWVQTNINETAISGTLTGSQANRYSYIAGYESGDKYIVGNLASGGFLTIETPNSPGVLPTEDGWKFYRDGSDRLEILQLASPYNKLVMHDTGLTIGVTPTANMNGLTVEQGVLAIRETTTPTADATYGKIYTKSDNKLYFQDGDGVEHEIQFV